MNHAYVAGLIDGEGCIHLGVKDGTYRGRVSIGMTAPALALLQEMRETWGGGIYCQRPATERWAAAYTWSVQGSPSGPLLKAILPHLILKRRQAELALKVEEIRAGLERRPNKRGGIWTPEARQRCEAIKNQLHLLNAKGPRVDAPTAEAV